ncbi:testis-expressed sequence 36 [Labeo rohita]|uniref:Testis-expressed sequence 36 n=1 Tax=Labeo rohita TaxID=84645 RepID=A0A498LL48_LABRO|nr:testis-expressed sequence 36 [Labeo rohita]
MSEGGKRCFNKKNKSGNWTGQTRDLCTSTGLMLAHGVPQPLTQAEERYPKIFVNPEKKTMGREYPLSAHDNRTALQKTIAVYDQGFGRKKCLDEHRQHNSHFYLCHYDDDTSSPVSTASESDRELVILTDLKQLRLPATSLPLAGHVTCQHQTGSCHQPLTGHMTCQWRLLPAS